RYDEDSYEVTRCGNDDKLNVTDKPLGDLEKKSPLKKLKVGDRVIIRNHTSGKWDVIYSGGNDNAYIVKSLLKNAAYVVKEKKRGRPKKVHLQDIKLI
uniref:SH3b domain-containing protein n=1 Tax=Strongyloides papillosus TaxID=174720 RepID=A0A0N5CI68_STREA